MKRYGHVIGVKEEKLQEYKELHAAVWPDVLDMITRCNIRNYSIYLRKLPDGKYYLFSYFEYIGDDFEGITRPGKNKVNLKNCAYKYLPASSSIIQLTFSSIGHSMCTGYLTSS